MRRRDVVVAVISVVGGAIALGLSLTAGDRSLPGFVLAGLLLANALVRAELARRG